MILLSLEVCKRRLFVRDKVEVLFHWVDEDYCSLTTQDSIGRDVSNGDEIWVSCSNTLAHPPSLQGRKWVKRLDDGRGNTKNNSNRRTDDKKLNRIVDISDHLDRGYILTPFFSAPVGFLPSLKLLVGTILWRKPRLHKLFHSLNLSKILQLIHDKVCNLAKLLSFSDNGR